MCRVPELLRESENPASRADHDSQADAGRRRRVRPVGNIEIALFPVARQRTPVARVAHDSDNGPGLLLEDELLPDRWLIREHRARGGLTEHGERRAADVVGVGGKPTLTQRQTDGFEVPGQDASDGDARRTPIGGCAGV